MILNTNAEVRNIFRARRAEVAELAENFSKCKRFLKTEECRRGNGRVWVLEKYRWEAAGYNTACNIHVSMPPYQLNGALKPSYC